MKKRATLYSLCATAMAICGLVLGITPASASIHNTPGYFHLANAGDRKCLDAFYNSSVNPQVQQCLDLENGDTSDGIPMQMRVCSSYTDNQRWQVV